MSSARAYLFIAHGSREPAAQSGFESLLQALQKSLSPCLVKGAYLTINEPSIAAAVETEIEKGIQDFVIVPLFFFEGSHLKNDIPKVLADLKLKHAQLDFQIMPPIASTEGFSDWVVASTSKAIFKK